MSTNRILSNAIELDFLYLDLSHCERCSGTEKAVEQAIEAAEPALMALGYSIALRRVQIISAEHAREESFALSPTVRVNGTDIQPEKFHGGCRECSDLCGCPDGMACREWQWEGRRSLTPPVAMIVHHVIAAAISPAAAKICSGVAAPAGQSSDMVERFFTANEASADRCCPQGCCE